MKYPRHLVPLDHERDVLTAAFREAHLASGVLVSIVEADPRDFAYREHREILDAICAVFRKIGTVSASHVKDVLRERRQFDALRLLPEIAASPAWCPTAAIPASLEKIRDATEGRRHWRQIHAQLATEHTDLKEALS